MTITILKQAWNLYRKHFGLIAAVVVCIWLPMELFSSYMNYFVFDPEDMRRSFKLSQAIDNFIGIIATAGVIAVGYTTSLENRPSFGNAMSTGARCWLRMWWTRLLFGIAIALGLIAVIIPGIYLFVRLALIEPVVVCERISGITAMRRSFELTRGHFWQLVCLGLIYVVVMISVSVCTILPTFIQALDHWLIDASASLICDLVGVFGTLCALCAYVSFSTDHQAAPIAPCDGSSTPSESLSHGGGQ